MIDKQTNFTKQLKLFCDKNNIYLDVKKQIL